MNSEDPRTIPAVLHSIAGNVEGLVKAEIGLAKVEILEVVKNTEQAAVRIFVGTALAQLAAGFLLFGVVNYLATRMSIWGASFIVSGVVAILAAIMMGTGAGKLKHAKPDLKHTGSLIPHGGLHHG